MSVTDASLGDRGEQPSSATTSTSPTPQPDAESATPEPQVVLYHGAAIRFQGGPCQFSLAMAGQQQRPATPATGIYFDTSFQRVFNGYGGRGLITRVVVPQSFADSIFDPHGGPYGNQPEWVIRTQAQVDYINQVMCEELDARTAFLRWAVGQW